MHQQDNKINNNKKHNLVFIKKTFYQQRVPKGYGNKEGNVQLRSKKRAFQYEYVWECVIELRREKEGKCVCVCKRVTQ